MIKSRLKLAVKIFLIALIAAMFCIVVYVFVCNIRGKVAKIGGYSVMKVITGSMEPSIHVGDYVLVKEVSSEEDAPEATPYLNDTVQIHYVGNLIPSPSYSAGYQFDQSYLEPFDWDTAVPRKFAVNGVVTGLTTALLKMHKGDHWVIAVPYQMGYGTVDNGEIPAYSTLIFEVRLEEFWTKRKGDRY